MRYVASSRAGLAEKHKKSEAESMLLEYGNSRTNRPDALRILQDCEGRRVSLRDNSAMSRARGVILVGSKGRGSNMSALIAASQDERIPVEFVGVIGSKSGAPALARAREAGRMTFVIEPGPDYASRLLAELATLRPDWICLAGYTLFLPTEVVAAYRNRVLNIHPSLLPRHGGVGMYGMRVHEAVLESGEAESGCTVHRVTEVYDEGEIVLQKRCPVLPGDTPEILAARVLALEHEAYPEALAWVIRNG